MRKKIKKKVQKTRRLFLDWRGGKSNLKILFTSIAVIMVWRGVWNLLDVFFMPKFPFLSAFIPILIGLFFLLIDDKNLSELTK